jgi:hypothetical protein
MKLIRSRSGDHIHYAARVLPVLRTVVTRLDAELLQSIRHRKGLIHVGVLIDVVAAIELIAHLISAANRWSRLRRHLEMFFVAPCSAPPANVPVDLPVRWIADRAGNQQAQLGSVSSIQRKFRNASLFDDLLKCGSSRIDQFTGSGYRDGFRNEPTCI